jgi:hypothetical protein
MFHHQNQRPVKLSRSQNVPPVDRSIRQLRFKVVMNLLLQAIKNQMLSTQHKAKRKLALAGSKKKKKKKFLMIHKQTQIQSIEQVTQQNRLQNIGPKPLTDLNRLTLNRQ